MPFEATWMDLEIIRLSEVREKQILYDVIYRLNLKIMIHMNLLIRQKQTHRHRKQIYGYQRGKVVRYKLGMWG